MINSNCPGCKNPWTNCSCYTCRKCRKTAGCTCRNVTSTHGAANITFSSNAIGPVSGTAAAAAQGGLSSSIYTAGNAGWYTTTTCGKCGQALHNCICISYPNVAPSYPLNPINPIGGGSLIPCGKCGGIQGMCACSNSAIPAVFHYTPMAPVLDVISDFRIFDIYSNQELETGHSFTIVFKDEENGFYGTMPYIKLPLDMGAYFIKYGSPIGEGPVWQILSPLLFKMVIRDKKTLEESTHFATMLDFYDILDQKDELFMQTPRFQEVVDNFVSLRLIARDSAYRKSLGKPKP